MDRTCPYCGGTGEVPADEMHVGIVIANKRRALKMSQGSLAQAIGLSRAGIANIENGRAMPTVNYIRTLAKVLKCDTDDLLP